MCSEVADPSDVVIEKQGIANFDRHAPAYVNLLSQPHPHRNQIFVGGQRQGACRLSSGLHRTGQQLLQVNVQIMYVHRPPSVDSFPVP
jgi:hypothetical protein